MAKNGATVLMEELPKDFPGLGKLAERQIRFQELKRSLQFVKRSGTTIQKAKVGNLSELLDHARIRHEIMIEHGLHCMRRTDGANKSYFIANRGVETIDEMVLLESRIGSAILYNPITGNFGKAQTKSFDDFGEVYLQLKPGESCLIQIFSGKVIAPEYAYWKASGDKISLNRIGL